MNSFLSFRSLCAAAFLVLAAAPIHAQQLVLSLNLTPRPNPYLSEWSNRRETAVLTVMNPGSAAVRAKLHARILLDGTLKAETKPYEMPVLDVPPGVSTWYGDELIPFQSVKFYDNVDQTAGRTGMLPAGTYQFCVELRSPDDQPLTEPACRLFVMTAYQAPVLLQPDDAASLRPGERPTFRWTPVMPTPPGTVSYRVQVFEVLPGQYPMQAFRANQPILDVDVPVRTQLLWPSEFLLPSCAGADPARNDAAAGECVLVWSVQALDQSGNPLGEPEGRAEPRTFRWSR